MADVSKFVSLVQSKDIANAVLGKVKGKNYLTAADILTYTIKKQDTAEEGYSASYQLFSVSAGETPTETAVGAKINIPKDMVVESGDVKTAAKDGEPYPDAKKGDKYIDLVIANKASSHIYIPVNDLVDLYTAGNGIDVTNNAIAIKIDATNANGLAVGAAGLSLAEATATTSGAMSASDKDKLDNADVTAYTAGNGIDITSHSVSAKVDADNANGLSVTGDGLKLAAATASAAGAMSAGDKDKLDGITAATDQEVTAMIAELDSL